MSDQITNLSDEAIQALRTLSSHLRTSQESLLNSTKKLMSDFSENQDGLGAHSDQIEELLQNLCQLLGVNTEEDNKPIKKLAKKLTINAQRREDQKLK